ncbi:MAG: YncE family protein [Vulcanimicrobiaceae bacterium]
MKIASLSTTLGILAFAVPAAAGQAPEAASAPNVAISSHDRVYLSDQSSNTVSVVDPKTEKLLGVIRLGLATPANLSPLYTDQLLVHGMGFSPDHKTLDVVSIGSNSVAFIDTQTNVVKHVTYVGRSPHEAFFTPDGAEVWVTVRGENYISVLDGTTYRETSRITVPNGPGMTIFSPDGKYGYVCSSFSPETVVIDRASHAIVGRVKQDSPFSPDIAATPDGTQVWETLKDTGRTEVFNAKPPFNVIAVLATGPITNHVNIVRNARGQFAYVTVGGLNEVKVYTTTARPQLVATIATGALPHGIWPSGDGTRVYVGLENADAVAAIDTATNTVVATIPSGQAPQGMVYLPGAVADGAGIDHLEPLGVAGLADHLTLGDPHAPGSPTSVAINNQGLVDILEAGITGLVPMHAYTLALATNAAGTGMLQPLAGFKTNPAGAAIVSTVAQLRVSLSARSAAPARRYLVIVDGTPTSGGAIVQIQR